MFLLYKKTDYETLLLYTNVFVTLDNSRGIIVFV